MLHMTESVQAIRCDLHHSRMRALRLRYPDIQLETDGFHCAEAGCTRHYTDGRGYFDVIEGRPLNERFQQKCPKCGRPMYLSEVEGQEEIWQCPVPQCRHQQRMIA